MEKVKITSVESKGDNGMIVVVFTDTQGFNPGEATTNMKWGLKEIAYLEQCIGQIVSIQTKQNGQYCNLTKVDMSQPIIGQIVSIETKQNGQFCNLTKVDMTQPISAEGQAAYAKHAIPQNNTAITESEKIMSGKIPTNTGVFDGVTLMSIKDISIVSQCMMKCMWYNKTPSSVEEVYESYQAFVKILEENG